MCFPGGDFSLALKQRLAEGDVEQKPLNWKLLFEKTVGQESFKQKFRWHYAARSLHVLFRYDVATGEST